MTGGYVSLSVSYAIRIPGWRQSLRFMNEGPIVWKAGQLRSMGSRHKRGDSAALLQQLMASAATKK